MVAFTWTITTLLTLFAFLTAVILVIQIHTHYHRMERYYESDDWYQSQYSKYSNGDDDQNNNNNNNGGGGSQEENEAQENIEKTAEAYMLLASLSARSITFVPVYTMILAVGLSWYGSTAIVGFTSLRGVYIAPCFSSGPNTMAVGIFGGAIVIFANLLLVCAVILGEVRVSSVVESNQIDMYITEAIIDRLLYSWAGAITWYILCISDSFVLLSSSDIVLLFYSIAVCIGGRL